jgi:chaperonin GroES
MAAYTSEVQKVSEGGLPKGYDVEGATQFMNIAEYLDDDYLDMVGRQLVEAIEIDDESRSGWMDDMEEWLTLATQVRDMKSYPWQRASNVKYPLMTVSALQFQARALPSLINSDKPVKAKVIGRDPDGQKQRRSNRVSKYMSYELLEGMDYWMEEFDRLLFVLPMVGIVYRKSYYSDSKGKVKSHLVMPQDLILNYHAQDYSRARMSHVIFMDQNELKELQRQGIYLDVELHQETDKSHDIRDEIIGLTPADSGAVKDETPWEILESHCWIDLDGDGYKEPYIVTVHRDSGQILRIVARWEDGDIEYAQNGKIARIRGTEYFTPYVFLPDPNSAVYGIGFGRLLGPTNETVNTLINQLVDAGTLSNLQSGFLSRGIKLRGGSTRFRPGEWKVVNTTGDDLRNGIFPMPVREPSGVLFNLLGMLISSGERISSTTDMMVGENPGQNQKATTTMAVLEQGLKVYSSIQKRIHRQLGKEYKRLYELWSRYLDERRYNMVLDEIEEQGTVADFNVEDMNVRPASDPNIVSDAQRMALSQSLLEKAAAGLPVNVGVATRKMLEAEGHEDIEEIMTMPPPQPNPEFQLEVEKTQIDAFRAYHEALEKIAKAEAAEEGVQLNQYRGVVDDAVKVFGLELEQEKSRNETAARSAGANQA